MEHIDNEKSSNIIDLAGAYLWVRLPLNVMALERYLTFPSTQLYVPYA